MSQEIIKLEDIVGGDSLVKKQELDEFLKKSEVGTAASKDEDYFAKSDEVPPLPQYALEIKREDIVWTDDYITIPHSTYLRDKKIEIHKALLRKGSGDIVLSPRVSYPRSEYYNSTPPNEFYLKDGDGYITMGNDFEYLHIEYSIFPSTELNNYDVRKEIGNNVVQDESPGGSYHSREMRKVFLACYPELWAQYGIESVESLNDPQAGNNSISANFEPKYMELKKANMLLRPYVNGALSEQTGSNPNILKVGSHYGNWGQFEEQQERNITSADDVFLTNVVAVAARVDDTVTTELQTTYGRGVEFFEDITKLDVEFPAKTYLRDRAIGTIDETGLVFSAPTYPDWVSKSKFQAGEKVYINLGTNDHDDPNASTAERAVVAEIINDYTVRFETALTPGDGKVAYIYGDLTMLGGQQQSPTCSIVGAKLKKIKLLSGANWQVVREAARMTAKKTIDGTFDNYPGHWDKFRGFGKIQPDDAIQYIKDTYTENEDYLNTLVSDAERVHGINPLIPYSNITDNTPVNKGQIKAEFVAKEIGKSLIADTEIARLAGVTNQTLEGLGGETAANKQNSLVADGTGTKYPTVDAVNAGLILKADSIDLVETKQSISTLESVLSDANINQEAQVTTSGVDTVSLPKTAANTGMKVQLFGQSAQNLVVNGDFRNGATGWSVSSGVTLTMVDGKALIERSTGTLILNKTIQQATNSKYYIKIGSIETDMSDFYIYTGTGGNYTRIDQTGYSAIHTTTETSFIFRLGRAVYLDGTYFKVDNIIYINLTATFGAGNEPTKEQCDLLFANYFEGSDNVLGTGRVRSVGKNLLKINKNYTVSFDGKECIKIASYNTSPYDSTKQGVYVNIGANNALQYQNIIFNSNTRYSISYRRKNSSTEGDYGSHIDIFYSDGTKSIFYTNSNNGWASLSVTSDINKTIKYILFKCGTTGHISYVDITTLQIERNTASTAYEPYKESSLYITTPELRSNGLIKDEIRKGTNGYELVKRVGVGALGSELITNAADREFSSDTGFWIKSNSVITGGAMSMGAPGAPSNFQKGILTVGKTYLLEFDVLSISLSFYIYTQTVLVAIGMTSVNRFNSIGRKRIIFTPLDTNLRINSYNDGATCSIDNITLKEITLDGIIQNAQFTVLENIVNCNLATPVITPIPHAGLLNSNANGTAYFEPIIADAGVYSSNLAIQLTDYPIASFESIRKYANGTYTDLNPATAVIASGGLSFTHPDLVSGDLVMFTYAYDRESIGRSMTLTHYDSRFVIADAANSKVYRWRIVSTNGVATIQLTEV